MRFVIIILLSLCHFVTKAHAHTGEVKNNRALACAHVNSANQHDTFVCSDDLSDQNELVVDVDDEDTDDLVSARKYTLLLRSVIVQFYFQLFSDLYQNIHKDRFSCSQSLAISKDKYIAQRVLRI